MYHLFQFTSILFLVVLLSACSAQASAQTGPRHLTQKDAGKTVSLQAGDNLVIELEGNPSTGYSWETASQNLKTLKQAGEPEIKAADQKLIGAPQMILLHFTATNAGQETLKLVYHRSWEKNTEPAKTFEVNIIVK